MEKSSTLLEFLPNELFVEVFSYLKDIDTVFAFSQLNHRFQCLLFEYCQFFDFKSVSKTQFDLILQQHNILQLKSLQLSNDNHTPGQIQYFGQYYSLTNFSSQLESLSLLKLKIEKNYNRLFDQFQSLTNLYSLTLESVCGETMSKINLPELKRLVLSSCKNTKWMMNLTQLEIVEYTIIDCFSCQSIFTWPFTLKRLKIIFEKTKDLELIQKSLTNLSQLITLEIYQKERGNSLINGQIWEELIHSSLPLLKEFKFYFQFKYQLLSIDENKQIIASFSTPFYVIEKKWFIRCDMYGSYRSLSAIYTIPFSFDRLTIVSNSTKKSISTYSNEISMNNIHGQVKTLILEEKQSNPDNNLRKCQIINLIINDCFNPIDWIHMLTKLRHLELKSRSNLSSEDFRYLLVNTPHLHSLTTDKCILRMVTENWGYALVCHKLAEKIQSLKLYSSTKQSDCLSRNDLKQIIRIFAAKCQHLSLPVQIPSHSISFILQSMSQLRSLHVHTARKYNSSLNMLWLEKEGIKLNNSNCIIINDECDCYFWLE